MRATSTRVLGIDPGSRVVFDEVRRFLAERSGDVPFARSAGEAVRRMRDRGPPGWIVVFQSWPDEFTPAEVVRLRAAAPLARFVCVYDAWCAGDGRTRTCWPLAVRVPVESATVYLDRQWNAPNGPGLPWTASRSEIAAATFCVADDGRRDAESRTLAVVSPDPAWRETWERLAAAAGIATAPAAAAERWLVDVDPWCAALEARLAGCKRPWWGCAGWCFSQARERVAALGGQGLLSKQTMARDLLAALR